MDKTLLVLLILGLAVCVGLILIVRGNHEVAGISYHDVPPLVYAPAETGKPMVEQLSEKTVLRPLGSVEVSPLPCRAARFGELPGKVFSSEECVIFGPRPTTGENNIVLGYRAREGTSAGTQNSVFAADLSPEGIRKAKHDGR